MNEQQIRQAARAGINDGVSDVLKGACMALWGYAAARLLGIGGLVLLAFSGFFACVLWEKITQPGKERREIVAAKARARAYWKGQGYADADIDAWDAKYPPATRVEQGVSQWWGVGVRY
jgi:hypothetical protein